jgi:hypothetical protein
VLRVEPDPQDHTRLGRVEVEDEDEAGALEDDDFVALVLERDVGLLDRGEEGGRREGKGTVGQLVSHYCSRMSEGWGRKGRGSTHLRSTQPSVLALELVEFGVKVVEVSVSKQTVRGEVELSTSVVERIAVARSREIEPLQVERVGHRENFWSV